MIDVIVNFVKQNPWIVFVVLGVAIGLHLAVFIFDVVRKPVKVIDSIKTAIMRILPILINEAEEKFGAGNGTDKKKYVLRHVVDDLQITQPGVDVNFYLPFIREYIEDILSTPQKKGE